MHYILLLLFFFSSTAIADFAVGSSCSSASGNYGNSQTAAFKSAISGMQDPCAITEEIAVPERDYERWYIRSRLNYGTLIFDQIKNRSLYYNNLDLGNATLSKSRAIKNQTGFEIAIGYIWSATTRADAEFIASRNLTYTTSAYLTGNPRALITANFKNNVLLFNGYYESTDLGRLKPYITYGLGISDTSVRSYIASSIPEFNNSSTTRSLRLAWQLGVGARLVLYPPRWSLDLSYRFIQLGNNVRVVPINNVQVNGRYAFSVLSFGIVYLF